MWLYPVNSWGKLPPPFHAIHKVISGICRGETSGWGMARCLGAWCWDSFPGWPLFMPTLGWALGSVGDSAWEMVSLVCGQRPCFSLQGFSLSLFHHSMSWAEKLILEGKVSRAQAQQCPAPLFRDYLYSDTTAVCLPWALHSPSASVLQGTWERRGSRCLFSATTCAKSKLRNSPMSTHPVQMPLAVECRKLTGLDLSKYICCLWFCWWC